MRYNFWAIAYRIWQTVILAACIAGLVLLPECLPKNIGMLLSFALAASAVLIIVDILLGD
jgi:hypothetical protein